MTTKMKKGSFFLSLILTLLVTFKASGQWKLFISNDVCLDYTWCLNEEQVKENMANLMAAHLDAMNATDNQPFKNRARYTCTVTNEIFYFLEKYPLRKGELVSRIREGRIMMSPFLVNTMWGFCGSEGFLRAIYPAKRFAVKNNLRLTHAVHSELPSLPWDIIPLLSGSDIDWINKPFLNYDATFGSLRNPPVFKWIGPDGSSVNAIFDTWASSRYCYMQGGGVLKLPPYDKDTLSIDSFWLNHYSKLQNYPLKAILAEGTHCDLSTNSANQAMEVAEKIISFNNQTDNRIKMVNSTFAMFAGIVDSVQENNPFMEKIRGSFGHSWELWPLGLAKYAVNLRRGENALLSAEALLAPCTDFRKDTLLLHLHRRAEWLLAMLQDHAWNGCNDENIRINSAIRKRFSEELLSTTDSLVKSGFGKNGVVNVKKSFTVFNPTNYKRSTMVEIPLGKDEKSDLIFHDGMPLPSQVIDRKGSRSLCFQLDNIEGYGFESLQLGSSKNNNRTLKFQSSEYILKANGQDGIGIYEKGTNEEVTSINLLHISASPVYAKMDTLVLISDGQVATVYQVTGNLPFAAFILEISISRASEDIIFKVKLEKDVCLEEEGIFLVCGLRQKNNLEVETTAAITRPYLQPNGDLLPGADSTRIVMQGFVNSCYLKGGGILLASPDAFCLKPDRNSIIIQLLGNNHNYREAIKDQNKERFFDFRFSLTPYKGLLDPAIANMKGKNMQMPIMISAGKISDIKPVIEIIGQGVKVICRKPADPAFGHGEILRLQNISADDIIAKVHCPGYSSAVLTDLLEQDIHPLEIKGGFVRIPIKAYGFTGFRIIN
jgi:hypothetical protein